MVSSLSNHFSSIKNFKPLDTLSARVFPPIFSTINGILGVPNSKFLSNKATFSGSLICSKCVSSGDITTVNKSKDCVSAIAFSVRNNTLSPATSTYCLGKSPAKRIPRPAAGISATVHAPVFGFIMVYPFV